MCTPQNWKYALRTNNGSAEVLSLAARRRSFAAMFRLWKPKTIRLKNFNDMSRVFLLETASRLLRKIELTCVRQFNNPAVPCAKAVMSACRRACQPFACLAAKRSLCQDRNRSFSRNLWSRLTIPIISLVVHSTPIGMCSRERVSIASISTRHTSGCFTTR